MIGYGFLSENSLFASQLHQAGISFIGPPPNAISMMGDKILSKKAARESGIPIVSGSDDCVQSEEHCIQLANQIGYPVMIKAALAGGGKAMRVAKNDAQVREAFRISTAEAQSAFGDSRLLVEKFISSPRHIEIQVLGDKFGNVVYFPERECSIQRRNQKVIEESPSVFVDEDMRRRMGEDAVKICKAVGYYSAGTCEFLVDEDKNYYFLELNTRLQVEHPVTEMVTGVDLVQQMISIAAGNPLALKQEDIKPNGWAIESRIYAEDPETFLPSVGTLSQYLETKRLRCDSGVYQGSKISIFYDPLLCKLIAHNKDRQTCIQEMKLALDEMLVSGVKTNIPLLWKIMNSQSFNKGNITTSYLKDNLQELKMESTNDLYLAAAYVYCKNKQDEMGYIPEEQIVVSIDDTEFVLDSDWTLSKPTLVLNIDSKQEQKSMTVHYLHRLATGFKLQYHGVACCVSVKSPLEHDLSRHIKEKPVWNQENAVNSPMPGLVDKNYSRLKP
ncbi:carbamoyl-phosphate synthase L chain, ATP binding domain-containing protein [Gorgonomyces haynaldii]|nr:carbamoyl-phosphate synthase L chain, ATP binding domain-containing protein [Gorgonomyces haynaldii]